MEEKKKPRVSYHRKPESLTLDQWQKALRREFATLAPMKMERIGGEHPVFADYTVTNPESGGSYKVAIRSPGFGLNFCTCMDFKTNGLGTCKHIEVVLWETSKDKRLARLLSQGFLPRYSSLFLRYGLTRDVMLRVGREHKDAFETLAHGYFDREYQLKPNAYETIDQFIQEAGKISPEFRVYQDAMDFILTARQKRQRKKKVDELFPQGIASPYFDRLLKTDLYPYQREGMLFAVRAGRALIADDMGLGKTIQAIAAAELLKKEFGIGSVLIICPTSLKYQWKSEIETFTDSSVSVIEGDPVKRKKQYADDSFYKIVNYNVVGADRETINALAPDLVILDEAQRIKNWKTHTARYVKSIASPYTIVLTGTPLENKLEELYSIVQFIDPFALGPLYRFLEEHQVKDEHGKVVGYKNLNHIGSVVSDIVIRRTKKKVLQQLPERIDKHLFVPLTEKQADIHQEYADIVARLVNKWKRMGFLDEKDRQRLLISLNCMRMVCDSTYILDQETRHDTKIEELLCILDDVFSTDGEKVVVFSQWERMTRLVAGALDTRKVRYEYLHGGIPSVKRRDLIHNFHKKPDCRVFLSTDAGGVGLNLQCASMVVNCDIPWNPAVLEQRIGRVHRLGQKRTVHVVNLVSRDSIEHRMLDLLRFKTSLFAGVLDNGDDQIFMGEDRFKLFMKSVESVAATSFPKPVETIVKEEEEGEQEDGVEQVPQERVQMTELFTRAGELFGSLAQTFADETKRNQLVSSFVEKDPATGKSFVKIPIENEAVVSKAIDAFQGFLNVLKKGQ